MEQDKRIQRRLGVDPPWRVFFSTNTKMKVKERDQRLATVLSERLYPAVTDRSIGGAYGNSVCMG